VQLEGCHYGARGRVLPERLSGWHIRGNSRRFPTSPLLVGSALSAGRGFTFGPRPAVAPQLYPLRYQSFPLLAHSFAPTDGWRPPVGSRALGCGVLALYSHPAARARPVSSWTVEYQAARLALRSTPPDATGLCRQAGAGPRGVGHYSPCGPVLAPSISRLGQSCQELAPVREGTGYGLTGVISPGTLSPQAVIGEL
jgi:hypothetical protein